MQSRADWGNGFIAVDWGTTNRRAYEVYPSDGSREVLEDSLGILSVPKGGFPSEIERMRALCGDKPMILAGMIGSNRGWIEAAYVPAPATLDELVAAICWPEPRVGIVPGVSWRDGGDADVMRGEEVQILGAIAEGLIPADCLVCHPGTHAKWMRVEGGAIGPFRTVMTGEMFSLLQRHSILSELLQADIEGGADFRAGVAHGLTHGDLTGELFSIRARHLLFGAPANACASYASGLLIGTDVRTGLGFGSAHSGPVALVGRPDLTALYAAALQVAGRDSTELDGERAFIAGARAIAGRL